MEPATQLELMDSKFTEYTRDMLMTIRDQTKTVFDSLISSLFNKSVLALQDQQTNFRSEK